MNVDILKKLDDFLGEDGKSFFCSCLKEHQTLTPVLKIQEENGGIVYWPVMWHEGRQIRNFFQGLSEFKNAPIDQLENIWQTAVMELIK